MGVHKFFHFGVLPNLISALTYCNLHSIVHIEISLRSSITMAPSRKRVRKKKRTAKTSGKNITKTDKTQKSICNYVQAGVKNSVRTKNAKNEQKKLNKTAKEKELVIINDKFYRTWVIGDPLNPPFDCTTDYENELERDRLNRNKAEEFNYDSSDMSSSKYKEPSVTSWAKGETLSVTSMEVLEMITKHRNDRK